jgi:hypothetical protein
MSLFVLNATAALTADISPEPLIVTGSSCLKCGSFDVVIYYERPKPASLSGTPLWSDPSVLLDSYSWGFLSGPSNRRQFGAHLASVLTRIGPRPAISTC